MTTVATLRNCLFFLLSYGFVPKGTCVAYIRTLASSAKALFCFSALSISLSLSLSPSLAPSGFHCTFFSICPVLFFCVIHYTPSLCSSVHPARCVSFFIFFLLSPYSCFSLCSLAFYGMFSFGSEAHTGVCCILT